MWLRVNSFMKLGPALLTVSNAYDVLSKQKTSAYRLYEISLWISNAEIGLEIHVTGTFTHLTSGANFIVPLNSKQILVLTINRKICLSISVFHRLARKLGGQLTVDRGFALLSNLFSYSNTERLAYLFLCIRLAALSNGNFSSNQKSAVMQLFKTGPR